MNNLDTIEDILVAIERPLSFASKNNFSNLPNVKGLDELVPSLANKGISLSHDLQCKDLLLKIKTDFHRFSTLEAEAQKQVILRTLSCLKKIRDLAGQKDTRSAPVIYFDQSMEILATSIQKIKGIGPKLSEAFFRINIRTVEDILYLLPRTYIDRRRIQKISQIQPGMHATVIGKILSTGTSSFSGWKKLFEVMINDGTQTLTAKWFNLTSKYLNLLKKKFTVNEKVIVSGLVSNFRFQKEMHHPDIEVVSENYDLKPRLKIIPIYPLTEGIHQKTIQKVMEHVVYTYAPLLTDYLPGEIKTKHNLLSLHEAFQKVHLPDNSANINELADFISPCHRRIVFDEFFVLQTVLALKKRSVSIEPGIQFTIHEDRLSHFLSSLPFSLTNAQKRSLDEILSDMKKPCPMNRLMQGDVGSGKTVVGLTACLIAIWNGYQSAIMAPTEILAGQHLKTVQNLTEKLDINTVLMTSSLTKSQRQDALNRIREGKTHLIIGTHSLIQEAVEFCKLGLAIVDEQHKFGVMQRAEIKKKGTGPDVLVMTATPIPRTLGLTVYGDLDVSIIDELPPGRKPVLTKVFHENRRQQVYKTVRNELKKKNQAFIVYPLVEESEKMDLMDATKMAAHLQHDIFPEYTVGLVHGKMAAKEKEAIMSKFQSGDIHILVATTVVEVGIDVPNASLMIIEHAERFGLSQLHQLRGRVGRGTADSICILLAQYKRSDEAKRRLAVMEKTNDGFKIAEEDFNIRGPGEFLGTRQSGMPDFRVAHIGRDINILVEARKAAFSLVEKDPELTMPENQLLKKILLKRWKGRLELAGVG